MTTSIQPINFSKEQPISLKKEVSAWNNRTVQVASGALTVGLTGGAIALGALGGSIVAVVGLAIAAFLALATFIRSLPAQPKITTVTPQPKQDAASSPAPEVLFQREEIIFTQVPKVDHFNTAGEMANTSLVHAANAVACCAKSAWCFGLSNLYRDLSKFAFDASVKGFTAGGIGGVAAGITGFGLGVISMGESWGNFFNGVNNLATGVVHGAVAGATAGAAGSAGLQGCAVDAKNAAVSGLSFNYTRERPKIVLGTAVVAAATIGLGYAAYAAAPVAAHIVSEGINNMGTTSYKAATDAAASLLNKIPNPGIPA